MTIQTKVSAHIRQARSDAKLVPGRSDALDHHNRRRAADGAASASRMHLPMRERPDAASMQQRARSGADLPADSLSNRLALDRTHQPSEYPANWDLAMPSGPDLRPVRQLPLARGLPLILNSNQSSIDLADAAATVTKEPLSC